jgi:two-component system, LytTR family, response regulator
MTRVAIIDDEPHIRETLAKLIERHCPEARVVGLAGGVKSGTELIRDLEPDLVLLDIYMGDGTGFDVLHALSPVSFRVIFISAMDKDMIRAFRLSGVEYLLKPVSPDELQKAFERVKQMEISDFGLQLQALEEDMG